jgi:ABC-2 type transport system permease protein
MFGTGRRSRPPVTERTQSPDRTEDPLVRTSEPPHLHIRSRLRELWSQRQIPWNLVRKEVKVRYKSSAFGIAWSLLNPLLYLVVFSLVIGVILTRGIPRFPVYLLSGLLAWQMFSASLGAGAKSVVDNANLVTKTSFPREFLPLSAVGSAAFDFATHALVLIAFMAAFRSFQFGANLLLLPLSLFALVTLSMALCMFAAALNVRYRDTQHLIGLLLLVWFWGTPIVYASGFVYESDHTLFGMSLFHLYLLNPVADIVMGFQRALYADVQAVSEGQSVLVLPPVSVEWLAMVIGAVAIGAMILLWLAWRLFFRLSGDFAEEL